MGDRTRRDGSAAGTPALALELRSRLRADDPLDLLVYASALIETAEHGSGDDVDLDLLVETLVAVDVLETTALLSVLGQLLSPGDRRVTVRRALLRRLQPMPSWLRELGHTEVTDAAVVTGGVHAPDHLILGIRWPGERLATAVVEIADEGRVGVLDTRVVPEVWRAVLADFGDPAGSPVPQGVEVIGPDEARVALARAIDGVATQPDPPTSDTWPGLRPFLRWLLTGCHWGLAPTEPEREALAPRGSPPPLGTPRHGFPPAPPGAEWP